jgi:hypothetical protein
MKILEQAPQEKQLRLITCSSSLREILVYPIAYATWMFSFPPAHLIVNPPLLPLALPPPTTFNCSLTTSAPQTLTTLHFSRAQSVSTFPTLSPSRCSLPYPPPAPVDVAMPRTPIPQVLSSFSTPPIIADTRCTGLLLQFSNFPALSPFFTPKPLFASCPV